jgi:hypothetical protein
LKRQEESSTDAFNFKIGREAPSPKLRVDQASSTCVADAADTEIKQKRMANSADV